MIRYILTVLLAGLSLLLIEHNPLWTVPLAVIFLSLFLRSKWLGIAGIASYFLLTLGRSGTSSFSDPVGLLLRAAVLVLPALVLLELVLYPGRYRVEKVSVTSVVLMAALSGGMVLTLYAISRIAWIGIYLGSDPSLQVFLLISLSVLFFGPALFSGKGRFKYSP